MEQTLSLIKPDAVERNLIGKIVTVFEENNLKATELLVIAPDHHGLFSLISGLVASSGYDVVNAKIITRSDGYALDTFFIQNKDRKPISEEHSKKRLLKNFLKCYTLHCKR